MMKIARRPTASHPPRSAGWRRAAAAPVAYVPWRAATLGAVLGAALVLLAFAPARWLASALASATQGQLLLMEPRGTVWRGSAQLALTGGAGSHDRSTLPGRMQWTLGLGLGDARAQVTLDCCSRSPFAVRLTPRWGGFSAVVGQTDLQFPASLLEGLGAPWNTIQFEGRMTLATEGLTITWQRERAGLDGQAQIRADEMSSRLSTLRPLGSYRLAISGDTEAGGSPRLELSSLPDSPLSLSGQGNWVGSRLHFRGEAVASPEHEAQLSNLLTLIGRRQGARASLSVG